MKKKQNVIISGIFIICLLLSLFCNLPNVAKQISNGNLSIKDHAKVEDYITENCYGKSFFTEIYGFAHEWLNLNIIGNFDFVKDSVGVMQMYEKLNDPIQFAERVIQLNDMLTENNVPLIFVSLPDRGSFFRFSEDMDYFGKNDKTVLQYLLDKGVACLDIGEYIPIDNADSKKDFFFRSDVHLTTKAEMRIASYITEYLSKKGIDFPATETVYDPNSYDWESYKFWGNLGRSSGRYFSGTDVFETFTPKFSTSMKLTIPDDSVSREGDFLSVMTAGYVENDKNAMNYYWVTNYGQWPKPYYTYDNITFPDGPHLLIIEDSLYMRVTTFLALNAAHVTVLDPRYFYGVPYLNNVLQQEKFDAVIFGSSMTLYGCPLLF